MGNLARPVIPGKRAHVAAVLSAGEVQARLRAAELGVTDAERSEFERLQLEAGLCPRNAAQVVYANRRSAK